MIRLSNQIPTLGCHAHAKHEHAQLKQLPLPRKSDPVEKHGHASVNHGTQEIGLNGNTQSRAAQLPRPTTVRQQCEGRSLLAD